MNFNKEKSTSNCEKSNKLYPIPKLERKNCIYKYNEPPKLERQIGVHKYDDEWFKTIFRQSKL